MPDTRPGPAELWDRAKGDPDLYRQLMRDHGHLLYPGDEGYEEAPKNLPCGWPGKRREIADEDVTFREDPSPSGALDDWDW